MEILNYLKNDFEKVSDILEAVALEIQSNSISRYPVFIATLLEIGVGIQIINPMDVGTHFFFKASFLEELINKGIISKDRSVDFKLTYKDPQAKACILLITPKEYQFVFLPYDYSYEE